MVYVDGVKVLDDGAWQGDFYFWKPGALEIGAKWKGVIEGLALYDRLLGADEAAENARRYAAERARRPAVPQTRVLATLQRCSRIPSLDEIAPYRQALAACEYRVDRVVAGTLIGPTVRVARWVILDGETLTPAKGASVPLTLEPFSGNGPARKHLSLERSRALLRPHERVRPGRGLQLAPLRLLLSCRSPCSPTSWRRGGGRTSFSRCSASSSTAGPTWRSSPLLMASTFIDYFCGLGLTGGFRRPGAASCRCWSPAASAAGRRKPSSPSRSTANLLLLGFFKYFNFTVDSYDALITALGFTGLKLDSVMRVVLPLGISFYTFKSMSYAIDVYRGDARAMRNLVDFFCFESMFPDLVAGPIIPLFGDRRPARQPHDHQREVRPRRVLLLPGNGEESAARQPPAARSRTPPSAPPRSARSMPGRALFAYAFQIYYDFSGYSDMAIGLALMLGFMFPKNFDSPYKADSITDFWRRWHLSLSTWLRDYLYIPLGGNRKGEARTLHQPGAGHADRRPVARRGLDVRDLGRDPWRLAGAGAGLRQKRAGTGRCPTPAASR